LPLIQNQIVDVNHWLTKSEFLDIITISQMTPGAIAINAATFTGQQISGIFGAIVATIGCVTPSCIILLTVSYFFYKYRTLSVVTSVLSGLRPSVVSLIAVAGLSIVLTSFYGENAVSWFHTNLLNIDFVAFALFVGSLCLLRIYKLNPIYVMIGSGFAGYICYFLL